MKRKTLRGIPAKLALGLVALAAAAAPSFAVELAAVEATASTPDLNTIAMWGFIEVADAATFDCATPSDPWGVGPTLTATVGDTLTVNVKNCLPDPVSVFIPGQLKQTVPVMFTDGQSRSRVRSFDAETAAGLVGTYTWTGVKEGTYLYHSGTHVQVQVQMGLYGTVIVRSGPSNYSTTVLADGPIHYYRLGESDTADPAVDETGTSDGTYGSAVTLPVAGLLADGTDTAAGFGGTTNDYVATPVTAQSGGPFSVEAWVLADSLSPGNYRIVAKDEQNVPGHFILWFQQGGGQPRLRFHVRNTINQWRFAQAPTTPATGTPFHVAGVFDGTWANLYVNGERVHRRAVGTPTSNTNTLPITIGADSDATNPRVHNFDGTIDEVAIYDYALTGTQIRAHFNAIAAEAVLVFSEIDPALHAAVDDETYGTSAYPSTFDYKPRYFLINGAAYPDGADIAVNTSTDVLLRFVNAGLRTRVPTLEGGLYMSLIAEDGNLYPFPKEQYGVELQAAKTIDAVLNVGTAGTYALYDRALGLTNWLDTGGGMLTYIQAGAAEGAPMAVDDLYPATEDTLLSVPVPGVLDNDTIGGGPGPLTSTLVSDVSAGVLGLNADGSFTYMPNADFNGVDAFTYVANDGGLDSNVARVTISVGAVNDGPVAVADAYDADQGGTLIVPAPGVLGNDVDIDGDGLTAAVFGLPPLGILNLATDGSFDYTPLGIAGATETFDYEACDPDLVCSTTTVTITVVGGPPNIPPTAVDDFDTVVRNSTDNIINLTDNDTDPDGTIDVTTLFITTGGNTEMGGTVVVNPLLDGTVIYTPRRGRRGTDVFQYEVKDNDGATSNVATVRVNVVRPGMMPPAQQEDPPLGKGQKGLGDKE